MRRASIVVIVLTFLALVGGTLMVPVRSSGLVFSFMTVTSTGTTNTDPSSTMTYRVVQPPTVTLNAAAASPPLRWRPLWEVWGGDAQAEADQPATIPGTGPATVWVRPVAEWELDRKAWALQLGLILSIGALLALVLRIAATRRAHDPDAVPSAAR